MHSDPMHQDFSDPNPDLIPTDIHLSFNVTAGTAICNLIVQGFRCHLLKVIF